MYQPTLIKNFISPDLTEFFQLVTEAVKRNPSVTLEEKVFFRKEAHNLPLFFDVHQTMMQKRMQKFLNDNLPGAECKPTYSFLSMYFKGLGRCPKHVDRPQCKYSIDICLNQNKPWGISVLDKEYFLEPGDALIYSGTDHEHERKTQLGENDFCDMLFFHFVDKDFNGDLR